MLIYIENSLFCVGIKMSHFYMKLKNPTVHTTTVGFFTFFGEGICSESFKSNFMPKNLNMIVRLLLSTKNR